MTITVKDALDIAREKYGRQLKLVFSESVAINDKIILSLVGSMKQGLASMTLINLGMASNYDDAKQIIEGVIARGNNSHEKGVDISPRRDTVTA